MQLDKFTYGKSKAATDVVNIINENNIKIRAFSMRIHEFNNICNKIVNHINIYPSAESDHISCDRFQRIILDVFYKDYKERVKNAINIDSRIKGYLLNLMSAKYKESIRAINENKKNYESICI